MIVGSLTAEYDDDMARQVPGQSQDGITLSPVSPGRELGFAGTSPTPGLVGVDPTKHPTPSAARSGSCFPEYGYSMHPFSPSPLLFLPTMLDSRAIVTFAAQHATPWASPEIVRISQASPCSSRTDLPIRSISAFSTRMSTGNGSSVSGSRRGDGP